MIGNFYKYNWTEASITTAGNLFQIAMPIAGTTSPMAVAIARMEFTLVGPASPNAIVEWSIRTGSATDSNGTALTPAVSGDTSVDAGLVVDEWTTTALTGGTVRHYGAGNEGIPIIYEPYEDDKFKFVSTNVAQLIHIQLVTTPSASSTIYATLTLEVIEGM